MYSIVFRNVNEELKFHHTPASAGTAAGNNPKIINFLFYKEQLLQCPIMLRVITRLIFSMADDGDGVEW